MNDQELITELTNRFNKNRQDLETMNTLVGEMERLNNKLLESEKVKSNFLSNIRNEIINPLSAIIGLSAMLSKPGADLSNVHAQAGMILDEALKLNFQLRNIFTAAEIEAGRSALNVSKVNITGVINDVVKDFGALSAKKDIAIKTRFIENVNEPFYSDADKLYTVLANLLANAIEFSPSGSEIQVINDGLTVTVQDNGIGIPAEDQKVVFDRFVQLNTGSTKLYAGHGLGLAVVKDLIEILGATIELESEAGKGSRFSLHLQGLNQLNTDIGSEILFTNDDEGIIF